MPAAAPSLKKRLLRLGAALGLVAALWACNAPFIPVPPPAASFTSQLVSDEMGGQKTVWITSGHPGVEAASAKFFIYDGDSGNGVIVRASSDGSYQAPPFTGVTNDHVYIYYQTEGGDSSETACRLLVDGVDPAPSCLP